MRRERVELELCAERAHLLSRRAGALRSGLQGPVQPGRRCRAVPPFAVSSWSPMRAKYGVGALQEQRGSGAGVPPAAGASRPGFVAGETPAQTAGTAAPRLMPLIAPRPAMASW